MSTHAELQERVRQIEAGLNDIGQQQLDASPEAQQYLSNTLDSVRGAVCHILSPHLSDPRLERFDALAAQCDREKFGRTVIPRLRHALQRRIAAERFGLSFDPGADIERNTLLRGALMSMHTYTFRDDLPYAGDRAVLKAVIALFPDVPFPH